MKTVPLTVALLLTGLALLTTGCNIARVDDEQEIRTLLNSSGYTNEDQTRAYGSTDSTVKPGGEGPMSDDPGRVPFVRFRRYVPPGGVSRRVVIDIPAYPGYPDTTALATITADIGGEFRTMFDSTTNPILVWRKPFNDQAVRKVYLTRSDDRWHIRKLTPLRFSTVDPAYNLTIARLKVHAASWPAGDTFVLESADTMLTKRTLPRFVPADTVKVWVTAVSDGDSCWTFLHHGRPRWPGRWRKPYFKTDTYEFHGVWLIGEEGYEEPQIRPSGHDAIGWNTLWGDTAHPYVAAAWGVPYVVARPGREIPEE